MGNSNEQQLRGKNLEGGDQKDAVDHTTFEKSRNPDTELRLDDEKDSLYDDGLDIEDDSETLADTHGIKHTGG